MVVQHEQNAGDDQDQERPECERAQIPCCAETHHALADFSREQVEENILLDGQRAVQRTRARSAAKDRSPHTASAHLLDDSACLRGHTHILRYCNGGMSVERSTIKSPSSLTQVLSHGKGLGAGPSIFSPVRVNLLPWHGHAMIPRS